MTKRTPLEQRYYEAAQVSRHPDGLHGFWEMKERALLLWRSGIEGRKEVRRHGRVSADNRHRCRECFCCACLEVGILPRSSS